MDSVTLAYDLKERGYKLHLVSVDYGQRHWKEISYAKACARATRGTHETIDLQKLGRSLSQSGSVLIDSEATVPEGHYAEENMRATVVPNRNAILLSVAWGIGVAHGAQLIATAVHSGDHAIYPDCRPEFIAALTTALRVGTEGFRSLELRIHAPFIDKTKADIVKLGDKLGVPWLHTWSCYVGGTLHCGACGTCTERMEAFRVAGLADPTNYEPAGLEKYNALLEGGKVQ
jgi:7-cyano-7-deazaguanine synthase